MAKKLVLLLIAFAILLKGFNESPDFKQIAAGVAIFLFGMLMLEDGFKLFSGGILERVLGKATSTLKRSIAFGVVSTTLMQSSSLVSVITISFLSAGLISLIAGVGIIFGANIGTTTGAWLVAGIGLKVKISAYAMPMLVFGVILSFQRSSQLKGIGFILAGLGFLFLGIHYMKEGFDAFKGQFDLSQLSMDGLLGLVVYTAVGVAATVVMQSSHATLVLIITGLAAAQITYENALALAIGANIGTTITAILGSITANYQGKRLALAHLIFNMLTAAVALIFINQLRDAVDVISRWVGIGADDYTLKLAVFHTIFNVIGVLLTLPIINQLIRFLEKAIPEPKQHLSEPRFLSEAIDRFPTTLELALRNEVKHLYDNAVELIAHGVNLHRTKIFASENLAADVKASNVVIEFDLDRRYRQRVKTLYTAIIEFATRTGAMDLPSDCMERIYGLRESAGRIVRAVKAAKHLRRNVIRFTSQSKGGIESVIYNEMRTEIAAVLVGIERLEQAHEDERSGLWLDQERVQIENLQRQVGTRVDDLIRNHKLNVDVATSYLNDTGYAYDALRELIDAARELYIASEAEMAEVERILAFDDEDFERETESEESK